MELPIILMVTCVLACIVATVVIIYMVVDGVIGVKYYQQFKKALDKKEQSELEYDSGGGDLNFSKSTWGRLFSESKTR